MEAKIIDSRSLVFNLRSLIHGLFILAEGIRQLTINTMHNKLYNLSEGFKCYGKRKECGERLKFPGSIVFGVGTCNFKWDAHFKHRLPFLKCLKICNCGGEATKATEMKTIKKTSNFFLF